MSIRGGSVPGGKGRRMPTLTPRKKILAVEDNAIVRADVRSILEAAGYEVCPDARDGDEAIEHVRADGPDLILLDLALPRLDGIGTASRMRDESDAPIVVLTGSDDPNLLERAEAAGTSGLSANRSAGTDCSRRYTAGSRSVRPRISACAA
jgi:CheY-like chemotaxis protein